MASMMHHDVEPMAMTDAELEDFLSFMDHPNGGVTTGGPAQAGPLATFAAAAFSDGDGTAGRPVGSHIAAPASSSDANGSSDQHECRMAVDREGQRSPGSSEDCSAAAGGGGGADAAARQRQHGASGLGRLPEAYAIPVPVPVPGGGGGAAVPVPRVGSAVELGSAGGRAGGHDMLRAHSVASLGSLTMPLEGLALNSPAVAGPMAAECGAGVPQIAMAYHHHQGGMPPAFGGAYQPAAMPMVSMGAFGPTGAVTYMPATMAACGSAPPGVAATLASTLDPADLPNASGGGGQLSTSWPSVAPATVGGAPAAGGGLPRSRPSGGVSKPPTSARSGAAVRSRGGAADATYHRSSSGGGSLSHSTIEKQRRDRLNGLLDDLGAMVPPTDGRTDGNRRPKHVILSDAIALLTSLQEQLRLGCDEISALRMRLAAAEGSGGGGCMGVGGGGAGAGGGPAASLTASGGVPGIDIVARAGSGASVGGGHFIKPEPGSGGGGGAELHLFPPTPGGNSLSEQPPGMLRCASSDAELPAPAPAAAATAAPPASVVVEQEGAGSMRVVVRCHDRDGLLSDLVGALKATGATIAKASITTTGDGTARDEFELRLEPGAGGAAGGAPPGLPEVRAAVLAALGGGAAAANARGKRTRQ